MNTEEDLQRKNLWHGPNGDNNQQFYPNQYQQMQHAGFDIHGDLNQQAMSGTPQTVPPESMPFLYDNHGRYLKIYFNENNMNNMPSEYELFDHSQHELSSFSRDGLNNYFPNTQAPLSFSTMTQPMPAVKNPPMNQSSLINHLVSGLGPNKTGSYSPFGETIVNNSQPMPADPPVLPETPPQQQSQPQQQQPAQNNVRKTRIVAEVKPMPMPQTRMSYSDVVSKNATASPNSNSTSSSPNTTMPVTSKPVKVDKNKFYDKENQAKVKKSPINSSVMPESRKPPAKTEKPPSAVPPKKKIPQSGSKDTSGSTGNKTPSQVAGAAKATRKYASSEDDEENSSIVESDEDIEDDPMDFYNIGKNGYHNIEKIVTAKGVSGYKKVKTPSTTRKTEKPPKRTVKSSSRKRQKHEVLLKLCMTWGEYLLKFLHWLWTLIYDVGYLSCGIIWDRVSWCYQCAVQGFEGIRRELNGSPGKAAWLWMKNSWKRFDGKFDKKSRWAFWRWMFKKKQVTNETVRDYYKDGKLPKTAEEAMKSLLNCKGKDAYSILGVSPNCSQEQIRKHYKKIAVLVHPDKNKQAGAEEAFKVLQRSFELIGEPESRQQYDQSMAEALHAEKAFTELNDLLVQLQTKISEAANTIRCSSCCFRHPRKPTGRKPFAARECSTCKIRHPAREGDIWAETSFFGFRWKYLALMEGNVYDITQWALCQRGALSHLQANSCVVQYKIVLGGNGNQQQQQQNQSHDKDKFKKDTPVSEPNMDDFFLNNIYAGQNPQQQQQTHRRRFKKN